MVNLFFIPTMPLIIIAAIYGDIAGFIVPAAACAIVGAILSKYVAIEEFLMLGVIGIGTGYYANRFRVREGEFGKSEIRLFLVIEAIIAVFMWLFARPMTYLYLYKLSMIEVINSGFKDLIAELLLVCVVGVPILIFMSFIAKQYMLADVTADNEKGDF